MRKLSVIVWWLSGGWLSAYAQQAGTEKGTASVREKIFVHTSKDFYVTGEIIWFKVYAVDASDNRPLDLSRVSYIELLNKDHKPVLQAKIAMKDAAGDGSFQLPYSINTGNYLLRAYTSWMKNSGPESFFEKTLTIVNTLRKPEWPVSAETPPVYTAQFFPEGGDMVTGMKSNIGFHVTDKSGRSVAVTGIVVNGNNETVASFQTHRAGMGHFALQPRPDETYTAVITLPGNQTMRKQLPAAKASGMVMRITDIGAEKIRLSIQSNVTTGKQVSVLIQSKRSPAIALGKELVNGTAELDIEKRSLPEGVSQITVFDAGNRPVCERLYFRKPVSIPLNLTADKAQYGTRKKVTLGLNTPTAQNGNYSMAVYQVDELQSAPVADMESYLWLQSDVKGAIESPGLYFSNDPEAASAADDLMLTQGWRRLTENNSFLPEIEGHIVEGKLIDRRTGAPVENGTAYLSVPAEKFLFTTATSGKNGLLRFNLRNFYGSNDIVVQPGRHGDSLLRVDILNPFADTYASSVVADIDFTERSAKTLLDHSIQAQVLNAYYTDKQQHYLFPDNIDTLPFYGVPDHRYYLDDYTRFITMEEVMREYVSDVRVRKADDHFTYRVRNADFNNLFETDPLILLDGVPVFNADKMTGYDPLKVKRIDVVPHKFFQHNQTHDGIISYSTYQGDLAGFPLDANALIVAYAGMQLQREFFSPSYENTGLQNSRMPDLRNTLYWAPNVKAGDKVSFYTSDVAGRFLVVLQGLDKEGKVGGAMVSFMVEK